ncbi:MAG: vitamin K epoxide reductase family protein [Minisyncoccia bacterium]
MRRETLIYAILGLGALGLIDSLYLASHAVTNTALFCDIGAGLDGCNQVAQSPYSRIFGIPLSYLGIVFYVLLLIAALATFFKHHRYLHQALLAVASIGALFSVVFLYIQFVLIQALCIYCLLSAGTAFLALGAAFWIHLRHNTKVPVVVP